MTDRVHLGYLVDHLDVFIGDDHWPAFNLAGAAINLGAGLLIVGARARTDAPATHDGRAAGRS